MIYNYQKCLEKWGSNYQIEQAILQGELFKIEKGIYSDMPNISTLAIVTTKYPKAIITMENAFYYHGLTDVIPDVYWMATEKNSRALRDTRIKQVYINADIINLGVIEIQKRDAMFKIYDKERMLIELLRFKNKLPYDYYKEILNNYRRIIQNLDIERIQEYAEIFPNSKKILEALDLEVF